MKSLQDFLRFSKADREVSPKYGAWREKINRRRHERGACAR